jgi:zinc transport system substrate-binding protein
MAQEIAGPDAKVSSLMSDSDDPHTFSPTPQTVASLRDADLFLTIGVDYEKALAAKIQSMFPDLAVIDVAQKVQRQTMAEHHHDGGEEREEAEHHEHEGSHAEEPVSDPHVWLSLPNLVTIADSVCSSLSKVDPEHAHDYQERADDYKARLREDHNHFAETLKGVKVRSFCVYHPVFGYFARDYDLHQATVEIDGKSPSPRQLKTLFEEAKEEGFTIVFVQPQFNDRPAQAIAERIGGRVVRINPLDENPVSVIATAVKALVGEE